MKPQHTLEQAQERAALFALGALDPEESREFARHLEEGCEICAAEVGSFAAVVDELALATEPAEPSDAARATVLARFATPEIEKDGVRFVRVGLMPWQDGALPQVERKSLFVDPERRFTTQLIRMAPGATLPSHRHAEAEEIYLIEGDLTVCGIPMRAGDYCRADTDSIHDGIHTVNGCVFLVRSSQRDERL